MLKKLYSKRRKKKIMDVVFLKMNNTSGKSFSIFKNSDLLIISSVVNSLQRKLAVLAYPVKKAIYPKHSPLDKVA